MAFGGFLRQSTAVDILIGPFIDEDDGKTAETALTLLRADIKLSKNGQALTQKTDDTSASHDSDGYYNCELDATDTNTVGQLTVIVHESGALPVRHEYQVIEEVPFDELFKSAAVGVANAIHDEVVEGAITLRQAMRLFLSILTGKSSGGATTALKFRDIGDTKSRLEVTVDNQGNRTAVDTRDGT